MNAIFAHAQERYESPPDFDDSYTADDAAADAAGEIATTPEPLADWLAKACDGWTTPVDAKGLRSHGATPLPVLLIALIEHDDRMAAAEIRRRYEAATTFERDLRASELLDDDRKGAH